MILVERIFVDHERGRIVAKAGLISKSGCGHFGPLTRAIDAYQLRVFSVAMVEHKDDVHLPKMALTRDFRNGSLADLNRYFEVLPQGLFLNPCD